MTPARKKLNALLHFGVRVQDDPALTFVLGFLCARVDRLHIVRDLEGADIAIRLVAGRRRIWPRLPFQARIGQVTIPDPATLVSALNEQSGPIFVDLDFDGRESEPWYLAVALPSPADVADEQEWPANDTERRIAELRRRIDHALDVYNECQRLLADASHTGADTAAFLAMAEQELRTCSEALARLQQGVDAE